MAMLRWGLVLFIIFFSNLLAAQDMERVRKNLEILCSPKFNGRGYVGKGDSIAAQWIAQEFEQIGLKKFDNSYFQNFQLSINTFPKKVSVKLGKKKLQIGKDFILQPYTTSSKGKAKILLLDTLIFTDANHRKTFFQQDLRRKALVFPAKFANHLQKMQLEEMQKLAEMSIWVSLHQKLTASLSTRQEGQTEIMLDSKLWDGTAQEISYDIFAHWIEKYTTRNVIGYIEGTQKKDSFVVFTGHYDHLGNMGGAYFPGANDNASGITMLLELAHYYKNNPPTYSVAFMAFAAEEAGLIGSHYYTENPFFPLSQIKCLFNLDLVGTGDEGITIVNGSVFVEDFETIERLNSQNQLLPKVAKRGKAANSDHYFFSEKGVKAFFIYTMGGIKAYHDINDRPASLPLTKYKELFRLLTLYVEQIH
ncbi:MAG: hypothetical protein OHK0045_05610 [Raineya sp.]